MLPSKRMPTWSIVNKTLSSIYLRAAGWRSAIVRAIVKKDAPMLMENTSAGAGFASITSWSRSVVIALLACGITLCFSIRQS